MEASEINNLAISISQMEYRANVFKKDFLEPEMVADSTSGSIFFIDEYQTPTSVVEENLERKFNEKFNLLMTYFRQEVDLFKSRLDQYQKSSKLQVRELNAINKELNLQKIDRISRYEDNWNGDSTFKFDKEIISKTRSILLSNNLIRQPKIFPTNNNTIQLEYERENIYLEIEVFSDKFHIFSEIKGEGREYLLNSIDEIITVMNEF